MGIDSSYHHHHSSSKYVLHETDRIWGTGINHLAVQFLHHVCILYADEKIQGLSIPKTIRNAFEHGWWDGVHRILYDDPIGEKYDSDYEERYE